MTNRYCPPRRTLICALLATLALAGIASARDTKNAPKIKGPVVDVVLTEFAIAMPQTLKHGWVTLRIANNGAVPHALSTRDGDKDRALTPEIAPGQTVLVPIKLKKGTFEVYSSNRDHANAGMQAVAYVQ